MHQYCTPDTKYRQQGWWSKVKQSCRQAKQDGYQYVWIDTCCINKESSAELQEAINSMFRWYQKAGICYAYLSDVEGMGHSFQESEWFRRGWTLQELLASGEVFFFDRQWGCLGNKRDLAPVIGKITKIDKHYLQRSFASIGNKPRHYQMMSWAASRKTSRVEDRAYSLLGLFGVNMPFLYGEGTKALRRLQEAILGQSLSTDLFHWKGVPDCGHWDQRSGLLAQSPDNFKDLENYPNRSIQTEISITAIGIKTTFALFPVCPTIYFAVLSAPSEGSVPPNGIYLQHIEAKYYRRVSFKEEAFAQYDRSWVIDCFLPGPSTAPHHQTDKILKDEKHEKHNEREIIVLNQPIPLVDARSEAIPDLMVRQSSCIKTAFTCSENHEDLVHRMMGTAWQVQRGIGRPGVWWVYPSAD